MRVNSRRQPRPRRVLRGRAPRFPMALRAAMSSVLMIGDGDVLAPRHHAPVAGQSSREGTQPMSLTSLLATLDGLPDVVARLSAIRAATMALDEIDYAGADVLGDELDTALE